MLCVYNSIEYIIDKKFDYILIDEAHHIVVPEIIQDLCFDNDKKELL